MANIYIPYGTIEGQTAKIAEFIADVIRAHDHKAQAADVKQAGDDIPDWFDAVIVGASVHRGKHEDYVTDFVKKNRTTLESLPCALFSVSMAAHGDTLDTDTSRDYVYTEWDGVTRFTEDFLARIT